MSDDQLSGRELDAAVAERVFDWQRIPDATALAPHAYKRPDGHTVHPYSAPHYSSSIEAAHQVVQKLFSEGYILGMFAVGFDNFYWCSITTPKPERKNFDGPHCDSLSEAICRAALKAIESKSE